MTCKTCKHFATHIFTNGKIRTHCILNFNLKSKKRKVFVSQKDKACGKFVKFGHGGVSLRGKTQFGKIQRVSKDRNHNKFIDIN